MSGENNIIDDDVNSDEIVMVTNKTGTLSDVSHRRSSMSQAKLSLNEYREQLRSFVLFNCCPKDNEEENSLATLAQTDLTTHFLSMIETQLLPRLEEWTFKHYAQVDKYTFNPAVENSIASQVNTFLVQLYNNLDDSYNNNNDSSRNDNLSFFRNACHAFCEALSAYSPTSVENVKLGYGIVDDLQLQRVNYNNRVSWFNKAYSDKPTEWHEQYVEDLNTVKQMLFLIIPQMQQPRYRQRLQSIIQTHIDTEIKRTSSRWLGLRSFFGYKFKRKPLYNEEQKNQSLFHVVAKEMHAAIKAIDVQKSKLDQQLTGIIEVMNQRLAQDNLHKRVESFATALSLPLADNLLYSVTAIVEEANQSLLSAAYQLRGKLAKGDNIQSIYLPVGNKLIKVTSMKDVDRAINRYLKETLQAMAPKGKTLIKELDKLNVVKDRNQVARDSVRAHIRPGASVAKNEKINISDNIIMNEDIDANQSAVAPDNSPPSWSKDGKLNANAVLSRQYKQLSMPIFHSHVAVCQAQLELQVKLLTSRLEAHYSEALNGRNGKQVRQWIQEHVTEMKDDIRNHLRSTKVPFESKYNNVYAWDEQKKQGTNNDLKKSMREVVSTQKMRTEYTKIVAQLDEKIYPQSHNQLRS